MSLNRQGSLFYSREAKDIDFEDDLSIDEISDSDSSEDLSLLLNDKKRKGQKKSTKSEPPKKKNASKMNVKKDEKSKRKSKDASLDHDEILLLSDSEEEDPMTKPSNLDTLELPEMASVDRTLRYVSVVCESIHFLTWLCRALDSLKYIPSESTRPVYETEVYDPVKEITLLVKMPCEKKTLSFRLHSSQNLKSLLEYIKHMEPSYSDEEMQFYLYSEALDLEKSCEDNQIINGDELRLVVKKEEEPEEAVEEDSDKIVLSVRIDNEKKHEKYRVKKADPLSVLAGVIAKKLSVEPKQVVFIFDGDKLPHTTSSEDHDLEDEDLLDVKIKR